MKGKGERGRRRQTEEGFRKDKDRKPTLLDIYVFTGQARLGHTQGLCPPF